MKKEKEEKSINVGKLIEKREEEKNMKEKENNFLHNFPTLVLGIQERKKKENMDKAISELS